MHPLSFVRSFAFSGSRVVSILGEKVILALMSHRKSCCRLTYTLQMQPLRQSSRRGGNQLGRQFLHTPVLELSLLLISIFCLLFATMKRSTNGPDEEDLPQALIGILGPECMIGRIRVCSTIVPDSMPLLS